MENDEIIIKSHLYVEQNITILLTIIFGSISLLIAIAGRPFLLGPVFSLGGIALLFLSFGVIIRIRCQTYDIYSKKGVKRIRRNKLLFDIAWEKIDSAVYYSLSTIIILQPYMLNLYLKEEIKITEYRIGETPKIIFTPMSKNTVKKVSKLIPIDVHNKPKAL